MLLHAHARKGILRRPFALLAAVPLAAAALVTTPAAATAATTVSDLPFEVDSSNQAGWWNPVDSADGTTYVAFDAPGPTAATHEVHVAAQSADGSWQAGCLHDASGTCATFADDNGHNQPSIAVDGAGDIHVFTSMHNEAWHYFRSTEAGDVGSLVDASAAMPDQGAGITYPVTTSSPDGDVYALVRVGRDDRGARTGGLYRYDVEEGTWSLETVVGDARGSAFYPDDLEVDDRGRVHILFEWSQFPASPSRHLGSYAVYDPSTGAFQDAAGATLEAPLTPDSGGAVVYQPLIEGEDADSYAPALQSAKMSIHANALDGIVYRFREAGTGASDGYVVKYATWQGGSWSLESLIDGAELDGAETVAALGATRAGGTSRVYAVVQTNSCVTGSLSSVVVGERRPGSGSWSFGLVGEPASNPQRLGAVTDERGTDHVYITTPAEGRLQVADLPRHGLLDGSTAADLVASLRGTDDRENVALGSDVTVSSQNRDDTGGALAVDGSCIDASRWISAPDDADPTLTAEWGEDREVDTVRIRSGYTGGDGAASVLRSATVELRTADGWTQVGALEGNTDAAWETSFDAVSADAVRILITDPSSSAVDVARIYEVEALAAG
ncbi:BNR-4 repeat-containing protein [Microbacterium indicum]|uniref:BNR-4 repeat-containing protein n=1 Tax=Microbacterium indicum TaxID=358100 RepID=UPI000423024B|nr:BNR-4 repeat-containing protein [Microbacterium indicum]